MNRTLVILLMFPLAITAFAPEAAAHVEGGSLGGFGDGLSHPIGGLDHVIAMVAVGLWGAFLGPPAIWLLPIVFPLMMTLAAMLGVVGVPLPGVELGIAASAAVLGVLVAAGTRLPLGIAAAIVGVFALFHGHAHGTELPGAADPLLYALGFVVATGLLHLAGIGLGTAARWPAGALAVRAAGGAIALGGVAVLAGLV